MRRNVVLTESHFLIKHRQLCRKNLQLRVSFACAIYHRSKHSCASVGTSTFNRNQLQKGPWGGGRYRVYCCNETLVSSSSFIKISMPIISIAAILCKRSILCLKGVKFISTFSQSCKITGVFYTLTIFSCLDLQQSVVIAQNIL